MEPLFISTKQASELLSASKSVTIEILSKHGLRPIDLGRGRGKGLRWNAEQVKQILLDMHTRAQRGAPSKLKPIKRVRKSVANMSIKEVWNALHGGNIPPQ